MQIFNDEAAKVKTRRCHSLQKLLVSLLIDVESFGTKTLEA